VFAADVRCKFNATVAQLLLYNGPSSDADFVQCYRAANTNVLTWAYRNGASYELATCADYFTSPYNDAWLHMIIVCDFAGKHTYFYRNGILVSTFNMTGTPVFPSTTRVRYIGSSTFQYFLTAGYLANVYLGTLPTCPSVAELTANATRLMLGLHPIWSV